MAGVGDILRATTVFVLPNNDVGNFVWNFVGVAGSETNYATIANAIEASHETAFADVETDTSLGVDPDELQLAEWDFVLNQWDGKSAVIANYPDGSEAGELNPNGIACVLRFITEARRRQARKFLPGIPEAHQNNDALSAGYIANAVLTSVNLNDDIIAGGLTLRPCVFNDTPGEVLFETHAELIQVSFVNTLVGYQRRRQGGAGI